MQQEKGKNGEIFITILAGDVTVLPQLLTICNKQGSMIKQGAVRKSWKTRWFVLHRNVLFYFKTTKDKKPLGVLDLTGSIFDDKLVDPARKKTTMALVVPRSFTAEKQYRNRTYIFTTKSEEEKNEWMLELNKYTISGVSKRMVTLSAPRLFLAHASAQSRALLIYCKENDINLDIAFVDVLHPDKLPAEFLRRSPSKAVPIYAEEEFVLPDYKSIFQHLHKKYNVNTKWYPSTKTDEVFTWYENKLAKAIKTAVDATILRITNLDKTQIDPIMHNVNLQHVEKALVEMEEKFLSSSTFLAGDEIGFVDIVISEELEQLALVKFDLSRHPKLLHIKEQAKQYASWKQAHEEFASFTTSALDTIAKHYTRTLIFAATSVVGKQVILSLNKKHQRMCATITKLTMEKVDFLKKAGLSENDVLDGVDIENPTTYEGYFVNVSKLFFVTAATSNMVKQSKTLVDVAVKAGVSHIVKLSALGADAPNPTNKIAQWHKEVEEYIKQKGVQFTFIRANWLFDTIFTLNKQNLSENVIRLPFGNHSTFWIDPKDIGELASEALVTSNHISPQNLSGAEVASIMSQELGREIKYEEISPEEAKKTYIEQGMDPVWAEALMDMFEESKKGDLSPSTYDIASFGNTPSTFQQYLQTNLQQFK